jgi:hypothetical protein
MFVETYFILWVASCETSAITSSSPASPRLHASSSFSGDTATTASLGSVSNGSSGTLQTPVLKCTRRKFSLATAYSNCHIPAASRMRSPKTNKEAEQGLSIHSFHYHPFPKRSKTS